MRRHQYGISAFVPQTHFAEKPAWWRPEMSAVFQAIPIYLFIYLFIYCIFHLSGGQCHHQQELKLVGCRSTVEPRNNPRDWQNLFTITRFRYIDVLFHIFYYYWVKKKTNKQQQQKTKTTTKKTCLFYQGLRHEEFRYIEVPLCFANRVNYNALVRLFYCHT